MLEPWMPWALYGIVAVLVFASLLIGGTRIKLMIGNTNPTDWGTIAIYVFMAVFWLLCAVILLVALMSFPRTHAHRLHASVVHRQ